MKALIVKHLPILVFGKTSKGIQRKSDALQTDDSQASARHRDSKFRGPNAASDKHQYVLLLLSSHQKPTVSLQAPLCHALIVALRASHRDGGGFESVLLTCECS